MYIKDIAELTIHLNSFNYNDTSMYGKRIKGVIEDEIFCVCNYGSVEFLRILLT